jgi:hypothetical protein
MECRVSPGAPIDWRGSPMQHSIARAGCIDELQNVRVSEERMEAAHLRALLQMCTAMVRVGCAKTNSLRSDPVTNSLMIFQRDGGELVHTYRCISRRFYEEHTPGNCSEGLVIAICCVVSSRQGSQSNEEGYHQSPNGLFSLRKI